MSFDKTLKQREQATSMETDHQEQKTPVNSEDYTVYKHVLPSAKTITDYKQLLAIQEEKDAATMLYNMPDGIKCTLHYDTTQRCKIDGEWPAIIFSFSNGFRYSLRPLFFAYETGEQIVQLLYETYVRLALTLSPNYEEIGEYYIHFDRRCTKKPSHRRWNRKCFKK